MRIRLAACVAAFAALLFVSSAQAQTTTTVAFEQPTYSVGEGAGTLTVRLVRSGDTSSYTSSYIQFQNGTATAGVDFDGTSRYVSFSPGQTTLAFTVQIGQDSVYEGDETFTMYCSTGNQTATAAVTIVDDDPPTIVGFVAATTAAAEHESVAVQVQRTGDLSGTSQVSYATTPGSATTPADYVSTSGTLMFAPGETMKTITIPFVDDSIPESDETFTVGLTVVSNASLSSNRTTSVTILDDDDPSSLQFEKSSYTIAESGGSVTVTVIRSGGMANTATVRYTVGSCGSNYYYSCSSTATPTLDFTPSSGTLVFGPGETTKSIVVPVINDAILEPAETFAILLSSPVNASFGNPSYYQPELVATVTITDDEPYSAVSLAADAASVAESAGSLTATVTRTGDLSNTASVAYETRPSSAAAGLDYSVTAGTLTFGPGEKTKTITVPIINDAVPESAEAFTIVLLAPVNTLLVNPTSMNVTITDDDMLPSIGFQPSSYAVSEKAGSVTLTVTRSLPLDKPSTVAYATVAASAAGGADFTAANGTLSFAPGETAKQLVIGIIDNAVADGPRSFSVQLSSPTGGTLQNSGASITITDDEPADSFVFTAGQYEVDENAKKLVITVARVGSRVGTATISYSTTDGSASNGSDYQSVYFNSLTFGPGVTSQTIELTIFDDTIAERDETFNVYLFNPSRGVLGSPSSAVITIRDDDTPSRFAFQPSKVTALERQNDVRLVLTRSKSILTDVVTYTTKPSASGPQATPGADFVATTGTVTFGRDELVKEIVVPILQDRDYEPMESFAVEVTSGSTVLATATVNLYDDDSAAQLMIGDVDVVEGNDGKHDVAVPVSLTAPLAIAVDVPFEMLDGTATSGADYLGGKGTIHFDAGQMQQTIPLQIVGDRIAEADETLQIRLAPCVRDCDGYPTIARDTATITIRNDDLAFFVDDVTVQEGNSGSTSMTFTVSLSLPLTTTATVDYATADGNATAGSDYTSTTGTLTFAPGETAKSVTVPILGDTLNETNETLFLRLSRATGAPIGRGEGTGTIQNDDVALAATKALEFAFMSGKSLKLDLYVPNDTNGPYPVIVWIPGDNWFEGSRDNSPAVRESTRGYAVASIDYRYSDTAKFPAQVNDVKAAIRWLRANAARFHLDESRIAVWGAGAGAHLASLTGTGGGVDALDDPSEGNPALSSRVQAVIDWNGPADLTQLQADALSCGTTNHNSSGSYESILLGCSVQLCTQKAAAADPTNYASNDDPPFLIMHGAADCEVSPAQSRAFERALRAAHVDTTLKIIEGVGHAGAYWSSDAAFAEVEKFLDAKLKAKARSRAVGH